MLVRRLHAGDCAALSQLFERVEGPLHEFCFSFTGEANSAARAANDAFIFAVERIAAQRAPAGEFRTVLLIQARSRSYDAIEQQLVANAGGGSGPPTEPINLDALRARVRELRPAKPAGSGLQMAARRRLRPATALMLALMIVLMVDMVALGDPFGIHRHGHQSAKHHDAVAAIAATSSSNVAVARPSRVSVRNRVHRTDDRAASRLERTAVRTPGAGAGRAESRSPSPSSESTSPARPAESPQPAVNAAPSLSALPVASVPVPASVPPLQVEAGPVKVDVQPPAASVCVGAACVGTH
jgi:DNA-directed RNA polymerase specialized sigma24 family protein